MSAKKIVIKLDENACIDWAASNFGDVEVVIVEDDICNEPNCMLGNTESVMVSKMAHMDIDRVDSLVEGNPASSEENAEDEEPHSYTDEQVSSFLADKWHRKDDELIAINQDQLLMLFKRTDGTYDAVSYSYHYESELITYMIRGTISTNMRNIREFFKNVSFPKGAKTPWEK
jgi:hypothetical protein